MAPNLPAWKAKRIDSLLLHGSNLDFYAIAAEYYTIYKTICQRNKRLSNDRISARKRPRPEPVITREMEVFLAELLEREVDLYLDELAIYIYWEFEVAVSTDMVSRALHRIKHTHKVVSVAASQQNKDLITDFRRRQFFWDVSRICVVDESASNERTSDRKRGWAPIGEKAKVSRLLRKSKRWLILLVYTLKGYLEPIIF
jgi:transposase